MMFETKHTIIPFDKVNSIDLSTSFYHVSINGKSYRLEDFKQLKLYKTWLVVQNRPAQWIIPRGGVNPLPYRD